MNRTQRTTDEYVPASGEQAQQGRQTSRTQRTTDEYVPASGVASGEQVHQHGQHHQHNHHSHHNHQETSVEQHMNPVVTHETIKPTLHEEVHKNVEKDIHQDHYRNKVQPIQDREVIPEKHVHNQAGVIEREYDNSNREAVERAQRAEAGRFRDERVVTETAQAQSEARGDERDNVHQ